MFNQEIPEYQQSEKIRGPPVLPPHLLQVILNKDTPISVRIIPGQAILICGWWKYVWASVARDCILRITGDYMTVREIC